MRMHILSTRVFFSYTTTPPIKSENAVPHVRVYFSPKIGGWGSQNKPSSRGGIQVGGSGDLICLSRLARIGPQWCGPEEAQKFRAMKPADMLSCRNRLV